MKKLLMVILVLVFSQCQIKVEPKTVKAQSTNIESTNVFSTSYNTYEINGIKYLIFVSHSMRGENTIAIDVHNLTQELLEIEKLKLEIANLKK